ncbi:hypothetical protein ACQEU3_47235 [Spirillospora sp. CA-253888]
MSDFQPDEVVDVVVKGVRYAGQDPRGAVTILDERGDAFDMPPQAAITRVAPAAWPPVPGDLWRDRNGSLWFALLDEREVRLVPHQPTRFAWFEPSAVLTQAGPLSLVRREDKQDGSAA